MDNDQNNTAPATNEQAPTENNQQLDGVRQRALEALTPLLSQLKDIDPERKFDICISAMRFTDDKGLAEPALDAALSIQEEGTKAEALVELINEISYLEQA